MWAASVGICSVSRIAKQREQRSERGKTQTEKRRAQMSALAADQEEAEHLENDPEFLRLRE